jgi:hypothetical protein
MTHAMFELTAGEQALVDAYELLLRTLREHGDELPPFAQRNAIRATAALWQVVNGLALEPGHIYDVGA